MKLADSITITYTPDGGATSFSVSGANIVDNTAARTLALSGGTLSVGSTMPTSGLLAYWALDETSGPTAADSVGGHTGTLSGGATWQPTGGKVGGAIEFDGINGKITAGGDIDIDETDFSVAYWAKRDTIGGKDCVVSQGNETANQTLHIGFKDDDTAILGFWDDDLNYDNASIFDPPSGWIHIVATYDAGTNLQSIYLNGNTTAVATRTAGAHYSGTGDLWIGALNARVDWWFDGLIDEVGVWNRALTGSEVADLYAYAGPINMSSNNITVTASSTLNAATTDPATLGNLDVQSGATLTLSGAPEFVFADVVLGGGGAAIDGTGKLIAIEGELSGEGTLTGEEVGVLGTSSSVAPGASIGAISITGGFTLEDGAYHWDLGSGESHDLVSVTGVLELGTWTLYVYDVEGFAPNPGDAYSLFFNEHEGDPNDPGDWTINLDNAPNWQGGTIEGDDESVYITGLSVIPEPSTLVLLATGLLTLLLLARRRRR